MRQAMKRLPPSGICMGRPHEMVVGGGEVAFALNMIQVSFERRESAWWSCLIGKKEDLVPLLDALQAKEVK